MIEYFNDFISDKDTFCGTIVCLILLIVSVWFVKTVHKSVGM